MGYTSEIAGLWTLDAFANVLNRLNDIYLRINMVDFFVRAIQHEDRENEELNSRREYSSQDYRIRYLFYGHPIHGHRDIEFIEGTDFESLSAIASRHTGALHIRSLSFASPGWVEVLGNLNPLRVIADAITEWRRLNTERENNLLQAETERLRIRTQFTMEVLRWYESISADRRDGRDRLPDIEQKVLRPTEEFIERIAGDSRVLAVAVLPPSPAQRESDPERTRNRRR